MRCVCQRRPRSQVQEMRIHAGPESTSASPLLSGARAINLWCAPKAPMAHRTITGSPTPSGYIRCSNTWLPFPEGVIRRSASHGTAARKKKAANAGFISTPISSSSRVARCTGLGATKLGITSAPTATRPICRRTMTSAATPMRPPGPMSTCPVSRSRFASRRLGQGSRRRFLFIRDGRQ